MFYAHRVVGMTAVLLCLIISSCSPIQYPTPTTLPRLREEVFAEGYKKLQELARTAENEHLAFFVEWKDGFVMWGRWEEGTRSRVEFPFPEWVPTLCTPRIKRVVIAHTHPDDLPPSEVDVGLMWSMERALVKCGIAVAQLVVTPTTTWELSPLVAVEERQCKRYKGLFSKTETPYVQRNIEKVARRQGNTMLAAYYRCATGIRARYFEHTTPVLRE